MTTAGSKVSRVMLSREITCKPCRASKAYRHSKEVQGEDNGVDRLNVVDLFVDRSIKVKGSQANSIEPMACEWTLTSILSIHFGKTVVRSSPVSLCQENTLLNDKIQDPLVGLACQQLIRDDKKYTYL